MKWFVTYSKCIFENEMRAYFRTYFAYIFGKLYSKQNYKNMLLCKNIKFLDLMLCIVQIHKDTVNTA